jgi:hypothetical protein
MARRLDAQNRMRTVGIGLVAAGFVVQYGAHSLFRMRLRMRETRMRTDTWIQDPGGGAAVVGELLMLAARFTPVGGDRSSPPAGDGGSAARARTS